MLANTVAYIELIPFAAIVLNKNIIEGPIYNDTNVII